MGPTLPLHFEKLGGLLINNDVSVTTVGLGLDYDENIMTILAKTTNGNHYFVEKPSDLSGIYEKEFNTIFAVVAQKAAIKIKCASGVRPVRMLGRSAKIEHQNVDAFINQLYHDNEKYILVELEVDPGMANTDKKIASLEITFKDAKHQKERKYTKTLFSRYIASQAKVFENRNIEVMIAAVHQIATENNIKAMELRDKGDRDGAKKLLLENAAYLQEHGDLYDSDLLREYSKENLIDSQNLNDAAWIKRRKDMIFNQQANGSQQG